MLEEMDPLRTLALRWSLELERELRGPGFDWPEPTEPRTDEPQAETVTMRCPHDHGGVPRDASSWQPHPDAVLAA